MNLEQAKQLAYGWVYTFSEVTAPSQEVQKAVKVLWDTPEDQRDPQHVQFIDLWRTVLSYAVEYHHFSPYYFEKQDRLKSLLNKVATKIEKFKSDYQQKVIP